MGREIMDVKEAIQKRRSIRKYQKKEVPDELIKGVLDAARLSPSAHNAQPWKFFVVADPETKEKLRKNKIFHQDFVYTAPVIIICCADPDAYKELNEWKDHKKQHYSLIDISIASSSLVLRAAELGLGTCFIGWMEKEKVKDVLNIPKDYMTPYAITLGYPDENPKPRSRNSMETIIIH
ncbi:MAG: nitroreductase family protein [Candidatus Aenigmatarchaeota archaeon]